MPSIREIEVEDVDDMEFDLNDFDPKNQKNSNTNSLDILNNSFEEDVISKLAASGEIPPLPSMGKKFETKKNFIDEEKIRTWNIVYPIYFDINKSHSDGRRVSKKYGIENPLAICIANACLRIGIQATLEPMKTHPKDWTNPGRVRIDLKNKSNVVNVKNKRHLYILISKYLKENPIKPTDTLIIQKPGEQTNKIPDPPAVPRGWKINSILPLYSPALSGGGVKENIMNELAQEMRQRGIKR